MPSRKKHTAQSVVRVVYMPHIHRPVVLRRGCIFVRRGPVASAAKTRTEPPTIDGMTAMVKNTIPRPPIHCVRLRQKSKARGILSTSSMRLAPVVVKPDMVSKKASMGLTKVPDSRKGSAPNRLNTTHTIDTTRNESRRDIVDVALRPR